MTYQERCEALAKVPLLHGLSEDDLGRLAECSGEGRYTKGDLIFEEGAVADRFYILMEGRVEVWKDMKDPKPSRLATHGPGSFFGEIGLIDDLPRSATILASEESRVFWVERGQFRILLIERPSIAIAVMTGITHLIRTSNSLFVEDLRERNQQLEDAYRELAKIHEEQLRIERLSTLGKFSSLILHDIRNPISMLKGQLQLMEMQANDPVRIAALVKSSLSELSRLERLANEFLDYSRGEIRLELAPTNAHELFWRLEASIKDRFAASGITVCTQVDCEESLLLDAERVLRALHNLADNARKAMSGRRGTLTLAARREGSFLVLEVSDTGEGMKPEVLEHVFEPFYSASGGGGTGLGMLIVKNIVQAHGGMVRIESVPGAGTRVALSFPLPPWLAK